MIELLLQAERALEMGRVDAAETYYRQVAAADPRNAIAVVGLARVALERGDELGAYLTARRALTIDRENSSAARMVERLAEVMRYRGETVPGGAGGGEGPGTEASTSESADAPAMPGPAAPAVHAPDTSPPKPPRTPDDIIPVIPGSQRAVRRRSVMDRLLGRGR